MITLMFPALLLIAERPFTMIQAMKPLIIVPADSPARKLLKELFNERLLTVQQIEAITRMVGFCEPKAIWRISSHLWELAENGAALEITEAGRLKWYELRLRAFRELEQYFSIGVQIGSEPPHSELLARAARIDAEIELLKFHESLKGGK